MKNQNNQKFYGLLFLLIIYIIIFRWKVQVASKGLYFRKPKVSLITCSSSVCSILPLLADLCGFHAFCNGSHLAEHAKHMLHVLLRFCPWTTTSLWGPMLWWRSTSTHTARKHPPSSPAASSTRSEFETLHLNNKSMCKCLLNLNINTKAWPLNMLSDSSLSEAPKKPNALY